MTRLPTLLVASVLSLGASLAATYQLAAQEADHGGHGDAHAGQVETRPTDPAAQAHGDHGGAHGAEPGAGTPESTFGAMMGTMHDMPGMPSESTGDVDADFLLLMIPHHQGAVDMARIGLDQIDHPEVRALAEQIIASQEEEIAGMRALLEELGVEPPPAPAE